MSAVCPRCGLEAFDGSEVVLTEEGWTHYDCLPDEELDELLDSIRRSS